MRNVAILDRTHEDLVADKDAVRAAEHLGNDIRANRRNEHHENGRNEPLPNTGKEYLAKRVEVLCSKISRGFKEREVEFLGRSVDRHDREREEGINRHEHDRCLGIKYS